MSMSTRPNTHAERETIVRALTVYLNTADADPTVAALHERFFASESTTWTSARESWVSAHGAWQTTRAAAEEADEAFDNALRRVMLSLRDDDGRADAALNQSLLGGVSPSELMAMPYGEEIARGRAFLTRLAARADLSPNPERVEKLAAAIDGLDAAAGALESAWRARLAAGTAQDQASNALDTAWGKLVRALNAMVDPSITAAIVPRFSRLAAKGEAEQPVP